MVDRNYRVKIPIRATIAQTEGNSLRIAGKNLQKIVQLYKGELGNKSGIAKVNRALAESMRQAVLDKYEENVLAHAVPSYRKGKNRYPKALGAALRSPTMAKGDSSGVHFIDLDLLDEKARFWARLQYGTEGDGPELDFPRPHARVQFGANQGFSLSLPDPRRPAFNIPEYAKNGKRSEFGYFNPIGQFFMGSTKDKSNVKIGRTPTKGIGARRFLDAGLVRFAENFKPYYKEYVDDVTRQVRSKVKR